jgi:hypothetical protein
MLDPLGTIFVCQSMLDPLGIICVCQCMLDPLGTIIYLSKDNAQKEKVPPLL